MEGTVRVGVLGPVEVTVDGRPVPLSPSLRTVVAALAVEEGRVVSADQLVDRIWDDEQPRASVTLLSYVSRVRARLAAASGDDDLGVAVLRTRAPGYQLVLDAGALDAQRFRGLLRRARTDPDPHAARATVGEALDLWRGPAYADVPADFARAEGERLGETLLQARELAIELDLALGRHLAVLDELAALVHDEPLREGLWASYALALYRSGRQADALAALGRARSELAEHLGVDPGPALRALQDQVLRQDPTLDAPAAPPVAAAPTSASLPAEVAGSGSAGIGRAALVVPPTSLVGREDDLAELADVVRSGARLLTLTGFGGVGKTRLASRLADHLAGPDAPASPFPDGVVLVPLATTLDPALVVPTIARALGQTAPTGPDGVRVLAEQLAGRRLLLVLDNLEHLLDAAPDVAALVAALPGLTVVATSRAPLRVGGEQEWPVRPLAVPGTAGRAVGLAEAQASSAVELFVQRARAVAPGFRLDAGNAATVVEIVRRLGGIPLAVELASARLRILGPEALLERLDSALGSGPRDLPERQRTMRATLDWSYRLLDGDAQRLYRRLAVFSGGWTLDTLQVLEGPEVHSALETLVEHSLVTTSWGGRDTRYGMLEPAAQHARSLLAQDELAEAATAHAAHFVELAERAGQGLLAADQLAWLEVIDFEHANLLRAHEWSRGPGDGEVAGRLVWALWLYWWWRSFTTVGRRAVAAVVDDPRLSRPVAVRARLAGAALAYSQGDLDVAEAEYVAVVAAARADGDLEPLANSVAGLGIVAIARGDLVGTEAHQREAIAVAEELVATEEGATGYGPWILSLGHCWLGTALLGTGRHEEALHHLRRGLEIAHASGDRLAAYTTLWYLAHSEADPAAARAHLVEGLRLAEGVGDLTNLSYFLDALVVVESVGATAYDAAAAERHGRLLGAAAAFRDTEAARAISYYQPDDEARDRAAQRARAELGDEADDAARAAGRSLTIAEALRLAVG
ncbi:BTAD domain-containing putative transcriptional regulator [Nocardioides litoris]|uniref:BTAD domain-containing putative transcriptional regulator n=1 Tax=Nocardioides litoris TaxID=1926648 RepID=UPI0011220591|nr:BTAD domain-containing putative transcriptional regulator [Nocardioides litoris]